MDYVLPDGTGMQALEAIHRSAHNFNSATIMITGQANSDIAEAALRAGCADYLTKDELTPDTFQRAVNNALQKSALILEVELQTFARTEVEAILEVFATRFTNDIKPMVSRALRQTRDLRAAPESEHLHAIEQTCMAMWETMIELERHIGVEMMAQTMQQTGTSAQMRPVRKPYRSVRFARDLDRKRCLQTSRRACCHNCYRQYSSKTVGEPHKNALAMVRLVASRNIFTHELSQVPVTSVSGSKSIIRCGTSQAFDSMRRVFCILSTGRFTQY